MATLHRLISSSTWLVRSGATCAVAGFFMCSAASALAQGSSCQDDVQKFAEQRKTAVTALNVIAKAGKGKLDPIAACPKLKVLAAVEASFSGYLVKNKDWCSIPDDIIGNIGASLAKTQKFAAQACNVAAQVVKMKKQAATQAAAAAQQQAARLPAGPL